MGRLNGGGPASVGSLGNSPAELSGRARRASEPPPVDPSVLFPGIMYYTRLNLPLSWLEIPKIAEKPPPLAEILTPAKKYMFAAMNHLDNNAIAAALGNLDLCISLLSTY